MKDDQVYDTTKHRHWPTNTCRVVYLTDCRYIFVVL